MATSLTEFVDYRAPDPNKKKNENNDNYLASALNRATTNKTSSGQNTQSGNDLLSALTSKFNSTNNNASSGQNTATGSNWSDNWRNNLTAMANAVSKGYPSTGNTARANLSANSGTSASQTQGNMLSPYAAQQQGIQNPQSSTRASLKILPYIYDEDTDTYIKHDVLSQEDIKKKQEKEKELAEEKERIEQILKEKGLLDSGTIRWMGNESTPSGQTIVDPNSMNNGNMPTATTPTTSTTSAIPTQAQPGFGTGTSIPYGQRNYSVFSGSNADADGNNGSLVKMGADGRTVNIDQSYATKELPSYTMSEAQYGTYDTSMAKGDEFQKYIGDKGNWSDGLLETVKAIDDYDTLAGRKEDINSSYTTAQDLNKYEDRNVKEGYSAEDLAVMSQSGLDSLNNAYKRALNSAAADYNRLGLRGSGFELGNSYGNTTDSITGQYLSNVAKLQNEIDAKGLEAAREDRFRNAEANDKNRADVIKTALDIGNSMNDTDNKRIENIQNIQEKNRNAYSEALKTINNLFTSSDQSQRGWASQNESEHKNDYDSILKAIELGKQSQATQYSTAATILNGLLNAIGTASSGGNKDALNGAIERINQITNPKDDNSSSYLNELMKALGIPIVNNA